MSQNTELTPEYSLFQRSHQMLLFLMTVIKTGKPFPSKQNQTEEWSKGRSVYVGTYKILRCPDSLIWHFKSINQTRVRSLFSTLLLFFFFFCYFMPPWCNNSHTGKEKLLCDLQSSKSTLVHSAKWGHQQQRLLPHWGQVGNSNWHRQLIGRPLGIPLNTGIL